MPALREQQMAFTAHLRNPQGAAAPAGIEARRMAIYRDLIYNNVEGFIANNFPVIRALTDDSRWHPMVRDFFIKHRAHSPYFSDIGQEFIAYLQTERDNKDDPPFLIELAHYEWVELDLTLDNAEVREVPADPNGDLLKGVPVLSPLTRALSYRFPVHEISAEVQPDQAPQEATHLVVYRDRTDTVGFLKVNAVTQRLMQLVSENINRNGAALIDTLANELGYPDSEALIGPGLEIMTTLRHRDILLGTEPRA